MKRFLSAATVVLAITPCLASAQMMGGGMREGAASGMEAGMSGQGMMSGMKDHGQGMMRDCMRPGGAIGPEAMGPTMPTMMPTMMDGMMDGMMSGRTRGCMMMAEGLMKSQVDLSQLRQALDLSEEQAEKLRAGLRPFQKELILTLASLKVADLELTDLLAGEKVDLGKVEAKLKEVEGVRTKARLTHIKAALAIKGLLTKEQLDRMQETRACDHPAASAATAAPQGSAAPEADGDHGAHH